jgi:hypothetical protein
LPSATGAGVDDVADGDAADEVVVAGLLDALDAVDDVPEAPQAASERAAKPARAIVPQRDTPGDGIMSPRSAHQLRVGFDGGVRSL